MAKGISEDAQIHISIAFLIKAMIAVAVVVGSWYQAQMQFAEHRDKIERARKQAYRLKCIRRRNGNTAYSRA